MGGGSVAWDGMDARMHQGAGAGPAVGSTEHDWAQPAVRDEVRRISLGKSLSSVVKWGRSTARSSATQWPPGAGLFPSGHQAPHPSHVTSQATAPDPTWPNSANWVGQCKLVIWRIQPRPPSPTRKAAPTLASPSAAAGAASAPGLRSRFFCSTHSTAWAACGAQRGHSVGSSMCIAWGAAVGRVLHSGCGLPSRHQTTLPLRPHFQPSLSFRSMQ